MPRISVKAFAELMALPAFEQVRVLYEQKYPKQQPQVFRMPYYAPALRGIREYYEAGRDPMQLRAAEARAAAVRLDSRREHNLRVIRQFEQGSQRNRLLIPGPRHRHSTTLSSVELTLQFDVEGTENGDDRFLLYNTRTTPIGEETAHTTLEIAYWVMEQEGRTAALSSLEYVDLLADRVYRYKKPRPTTLKNAGTNAKVIASLWPTI
jgi:hypothetical protein